MLPLFNTGTSSTTVLASRAPDRKQLLAIQLPNQWSTVYSCMQFFFLTLFCRYLFVAFYLYRSFVSTLQLHYLKTSTTDEIKLLFIIHHIHYSLCRVHIYDLFVNKYTPICVQAVVPKKRVGITKI